MMTKAERKRAFQREADGLNALITSGDYEILVQAGHSAAKAAEIVLDASRGDTFCIRWIAEMRRNIETAECECRFKEVSG